MGEIIERDSEGKVVGITWWPNQVDATDPNVAGSICIDFMVCEGECGCCNAVIHPGTRMFMKQPRGVRSWVGICGDCIGPHIETNRKAALALIDSENERKAIQDGGC